MSPPSGGVSLSRATLRRSLVAPDGEGATLAGIGFTIALFITDLAFSDEAGRERAAIRVPAAQIHRPRRSAGIVCCVPSASGFSLCSRLPRGTDAAAPALGRAVRPGLTRSTPPRWPGAGPRH